MTTSQSNLLEARDSFIHRHIGPRQTDIQKMLTALGVSSLEELISATVPPQIRTKKNLQLGSSQSEFDAVANLKKTVSTNQVFRSFLGMGYSDCITPPVIQRNILENPGWYTQYTPYQAEIAQGRLEALLNFQTMVMDLTGFQIANASMLDESTAAAEAMMMCFALKGKDLQRAFFVAESCHPQTISLVRTRAEPFGIKVIVGDPLKWKEDQPIFGALLQYPATDGTVYSYKKFIDQIHQAGALAIVAADILSLALLVPPAEIGADIAVGSTQRLGVPLGYGGPHAAYFATRDEFKRQIPGRIVGVSQDTNGKPAIRLALQTREQHIRRDKATSNICTSQVLLAIIASMYAVYHGPEGIRKIAERVHFLAAVFKKGIEDLGYTTSSSSFFDGIKIQTDSSKLKTIFSNAQKNKINLRVLDDKHLFAAFDEVTSSQDLSDLLLLFADAVGKKPKSVQDLSKETQFGIESSLLRKTEYLKHPIFNSYRSETEMLRYLYRLQQKDLSLANSMIPLGSCTMKLNATSEMLPVTWPEMSKIHPFVPLEQTQGYQKMFHQLESMLADLTGFSAVSLQPNAGSQGEYAGLLVIRKYHQSKGQSHRDVCLIPRSAHGTNPASAAMAGMKVVVVGCDSNGNIDLEDLKLKAHENRDHLSALMVTYPSTHGVFEEAILEVCEVVHKNGGQVYMDGANMNAQIGLCRPGEFGADVCHLNLHKTFCIPHGGGGPGMGPIGVKSHLAPFLPGHPVVELNHAQTIGPISAAPWGSASILPISWMYITMMGAEGLTLATQVAILNANYIARKLAPHYPVLYQGKKGFVAHECIFDLRNLKDTAGIEVEDVAKRLMDYGFHAPTISFPVAGTLMVEPTESESLAELDRFCDAMILIRQEIAEIEKGQLDRSNNMLKNAPHTAEQISKSEWNHPYSRERAVYPAAWVRDQKFWPSVGRINNVLGDRNLVCACLPIDAYESTS